MTVSSDKSIIVFDVFSRAVLSKVESAHEMGIYDVRWLSDNSIVTCSADNTLKTWSVSTEGSLEIKDTFIQKDGPRDTNL